MSDDPESQDEPASTSSPDGGGTTGDDGGNGQDEGWNHGTIETTGIKSGEPPRRVVAEDR